MSSISFVHLLDSSVNLLLIEKKSVEFVEFTVYDENSDTGVSSSISEIIVDDVD